MTTPAQAYGHPNFVDDVAVQGPTDQGLRANDCYYAKNFLPAQPSCVDCKGPIPMWANTVFSPVRGPSAGIGDQVALSGVGLLGFVGVDGPNDDVWTKLNPAQQAWLADAFRKLNDLIVQTTGSSCPTWNPSNITSVVTCYKQWFNANYAGKLTDANGQPVALSPTTVFDQATLDSFLTITGMNAKDFPIPYPGGPAAPAEKKGLSKGAMIGIGVAGAAAVGLAVMASGSKKKSRRR